MRKPSKKFVKTIITIFCVIAMAWVIACVGLYAVMRQSTERFGKVMARIPGPVPFLVLPFETLWTHARAGKLEVGEPAADFSLATLDKSTHIQLSSLSAQGRPVVLIFGSYT